MMALKGWVGANLLPRVQGVFLRVCRTALKSPHDT